MKTRPILFNGDMVRAILDGRKTQTRRVMKVQPSDAWELDCYTEIHGYDKNGELSPDIIKGWGVCNRDGDEGYVCPFGAVGDLLWLRETHGHDGCGGGRYRADDSEIEGNWMLVKGWCPSIHLPRTASRITLEITGVRVERLQNISTADAIAEGLEVTTPYDDNHRFYNGIGGDPIAAYRKIWDSINAKKHDQKWDTNPWVWVIEFKPHMMNVDAYLAQNGGA